MNRFDCFISALLLICGLLLQGCAEEIEPGTATVKTYTMTVVASKGEIGTKALDLTNGTLIATWSRGDRVQVYNKTRNTALDGYLVAQENGTSTTLKGTLTGTIAASDNLTLKFLDSNYSEQDGTIEYIAANCDYAAAEVTVKRVKKGNVTTTADASFIYQQAIVEFTLNESDGSAVSGGVKKLSVVIGGTTITVVPSSAKNVLYVAIPPISNGSFSMNAVDPNGAPRSYNEAGATFENGKYYKIGVDMDCVVMSDSDLFAANTSKVPRIVLGADIEMTSQKYVTISGSSTVDLNGHSIAGFDKGNLSCARIFYVDDDQSLTLNGPGTLKDCHADEGGAIYNRGTLVINDVTFTGCSASLGGAVYNCEGASLTLSDVTLSGNYTEDRTSKPKPTHGGAIYSDGVLNMSGAIVATGNKGENDTPDNIYLASGKVINVKGAFAGDAGIGVTLADGSGIITSGYSTYNGSTDPARVFSSDDAVYPVSLRNGEVALWRYYNVTSEKNYSTQQLLLDKTGYDLSGVQYMLSILFPERTNPVSAISYTYSSVDPQGNPVELSALLYVPDAALDGTRELTGICLTNHGTIASNAECPTMNVQFEGAFAWKNYAIVMPDYYGFGASADRPQAYLDAETTGRGSIDAYLAAVQLLKDRKVSIPDKLYSFGYSQGGFNSMANLKYVSKHPELHIHFEKVMCGGSPFDVELTWNAYAKGTFRNAIAFVPMTVVSINESQQLGLDYADLFKGNLLDNWQDWILSKNYSISSINSMLGTNDFSAIMNDSFMTRTGDAYKAIMNVCRQYSLTSGWVPPSGTKIIIYHSRQDDTVPYANLTAMKAFLDEVAPGCYSAHDGNDGGHIDAVIRFVKAIISEW